MDDKVLRAQTVLNEAKKCFNGMGISYNENIEEHSIESGLMINDVRTIFEIKAHANEETLVLTAITPIHFSAKQFLDAAIAVAAINKKLFVGSYIYSNASGRVYFRTTNSYRGGGINAEIINVMIATAYETVSKYNDLLVRLALGGLTFEEFMRTLWKDGTEAQDAYWNERSYIFTMTPAELDAYIEKEYKSCPEKYEVRGFRTGYAPISSIKKALGVERFLDGAVREFILKKAHELGADDNPKFSYMLMNNDEYNCVSIRVTIGK